MRQGPQHRDGMTLVELMVALIAGGIIVIGCTFLLVRCNEDTAAGSRKVRNQQDMSFAMNRIGQLTRGGTNFVLGSGGATLRVERRAFGAPYWWRTILAENGALKVRDENGNDEIVLPAGVASLTFQLVSMGAMPVHKDAAAVQFTVGVGNEAVQGASTFVARLPAR